MGHRFAISAPQKVARRRAAASPEGIPGGRGAGASSALFGGIQASSASLEEPARVPGISRKIAEDLCHLPQPEWDRRDRTDEHSERPTLFRIALILVFVIVFYLPAGASSPPRW
jgi:hypothetical protein